MKITKDKNTVVVELTKDELMEHNLTYSLLDCTSVHTRSVILKILLEATGNNLLSGQEVYLLPDSDEGCVIVFKEKGNTDFDSVSFSFLEIESEIFSSFFS